MDRDINADLPDTAFWRAYNGRFAGVLSWSDFDALWDRLAVSGGDWYVFDAAGDAPLTPVSAGEFSDALTVARACIEQVRDRSYCGAVYVDDPEKPSFVKAFDPYKMGASCGSSGDRVLPRWIFSRLAPDALPVLDPPRRTKGLFARWLG